MSEEWVASSCWVFAGQPLSLGCENAKGDKRKIMLTAEFMRKYDDDQGMDCQTSAHGHSRVFDLATGKNINANMTIRLTLSKAAGLDGKRVGATPKRR